MAGSKGHSSRRVPSGLDGRPVTPRTPGGLSSTPLVTADASRLQATLQDQITGTLGRLGHVSSLLNTNPELAVTHQLDDLLEQVIKAQDEIADKHRQWAEITGGDASRTMQLGITGGITREATTRFDGQDHNKEVYYERAIQTIEQQLQAFQRSLDEANIVNVEAEKHDGGRDGASDTTESDEEDVAHDEDDLEAMEADRGEAAVAAYMHRCALPTREELIEEDKTYAQFKRRIHFDVLGCFLFFFFIFMTIGYAYVRIQFSIAPLGSLLWYGALVFAVEMIGAASIMFYGVWLIARPDNSDILSGPGASVLRRRYHIRVLVPTYSEPLPIVQRTVLAARRAIVPPGCKMTIYLCDDGKRADKRQFVDALNKSPGPPVVYVTGRKRSAGRTLNGKSENLNHCLKLIFPEDRADDEVPNILLTELMCLFDADQSCSRTFFTSLLPYIDSGDNVAVALSPQLMFNVQPNIDIFNHQNVHFWEKMQPGMDALGFISLTGTNMILRCRALQDCGWFPVDSVTEDWELGMRMKKWGWHCRYVQQYNAIGEAPDEVRQCFQQRSRWCKGHFQTFWSSQCPLVDRRLGIFFQLTYSSTCLSYISAALAVPLMTLVPIITLLFGYFPIALNFWTVVAISCYYVALHLLTYYSRSVREFRALWLATVSTTILFWPYGKAALQTPFKQCLGRGLTFKSTSKGRSQNTVTLKEVGPSLLLVLASLLAFISGLTDFNVNVNAPKAIALCWVFYNIVPHMLLLIYSRFGAGGVLRFACNFSVVFQSLVSLLALVLLWILYPREEDYVHAVDLSLRFLNAQRSGVIASNAAGAYAVPWRFTSGLQDESTLAFTSVDFFGNPLGPAPVTADLSAGYWNDGEVGPVKVTTHVAATTAMLAWSLLDFPDWWRADAARLAAALDLVRHGLAYVDQCYVPNPLTGLADTDSDVLIYLVGDILLERTRWKRPEDIRSVQPVEFITMAESPADLAGQVTAGLVAGALALYSSQSISALEATAFVDKAHRLFVSAMYVPTLYTLSANISGTPITDNYPSNSYLDDLFWASTWLLRASQNGLRAFNATYYYTAARTTFELAFAERDSMAVSLDYMNNAALVHAAVITDDWSFHSAAQSWIWDWICSGDVTYTTFGRAYHPEAPMLGDTALASALAAVYVHAAEGWDVASENEQMITGFHCFAEGQGRLFLGVNYRKPLLTSFNNRDYDRLWHRGASCPQVPTPCDISVAFSQDQDQNDLEGALLWLPGFRDSCPDVRGDGENGTVVSLENNIAVPLLFAALAERSERRSYFDCLQGQGALLEHPVCRYNRPLPERLGPLDVPPAESMLRFRGIWTQADSRQSPPPPPPTPLDATGDGVLTAGGTQETLGTLATADTGALRR